jgi:hypothetical protein
MNIKFKQWNCSLDMAQYGNGRIALRLTDLEPPYGPVAVATVNLVDDATQPNEVVIKNYAENEGIYESLLEQNIITAAHRYATNGYVVCPVCYLVGSEPTADSTPSTKIIRVSPISGKENTIELPITPEQMAAYENGVYIQVAMPNLTAEQREFVMSGITPSEWDEMFANDEEDY